MTVLAKIVDFLNNIGIETSEGVVPDSSFLPGVRITSGQLVYDPASLTWPGDLLHEAGHIATVPSSLRSMLSDGVELPEPATYATEAEATAWAYAAVRHLQLDPAVLFHCGGYHGASDRLISTFSLGVYPGAFGLAQSGMTVVAEDTCAHGASVYPEMRQWLRS
ncbi:hypothetical protein N800_08880 [Lysobacter daejeonensis GH1-9]|uniref:Uncharacterized protein n=1 Tax=Lysobacter daejeonensis GH1-9 TaxID=1385517 RepID=A0A0A0F0L7_9GAMM|nr:hypothetical protein [Lysobacter daejeonensis]KGM56299.1 hypothetical protein N800_08880 [Lysobacter daejeonensis GH1-9]